VREPTLQTPRPVKKEGEEVLQALEQIPLQPVMKTMVRQAVPLQPMRVHGAADIHLQPVEGTPCCSRWMCLKEAVTPWGAPAGAGSWQDLWSRGERSPHWSRFAGRACDPMGDPR